MVFLPRFYHEKYEAFLYIFPGHIHFPGRRVLRVLGILALGLSPAPAAGARSQHLVVNPQMIWVVTKGLRSGLLTNQIVIGVLTKSH